MGRRVARLWLSDHLVQQPVRLPQRQDRGLERRVQAIETNGSPVVQAIRTEVSINSRRISSLEELYGTKVSGLLTDNAAQAERLRHLEGNMDSLLQWRVSHIGEDANLDGRLAGIDHQLQQLEAQQTTLVRDLAAIARPRPRP